MRYEAARGAPIGWPTRAGSMRRLIPESHHTHSQAPTLAMTVASSVIIYGLVNLM